MAKHNSRKHKGKNRFLIVVVVAVYFVNRSRITIKFFCFDAIINEISTNINSYFVTLKKHNQFRKDEIPFYLTKIYYYFYSCKVNSWQITQRRLFYSSFSQQFDMLKFRLSKRFEDWSFQILTFRWIYRERSLKLRVNKIKCDDGHELGNRICIIRIFAVLFQAIIKK